METRQASISDPKPQAPFRYDSPGQVTPGNVRLETLMRCMLSKLLFIAGRKIIGTVVTYSTEENTQPPRNKHVDMGQNSENLGPSARSQSDPTLTLPNHRKIQCYPRQ